MNILQQKAQKLSLSVAKQKDALITEAIEHGCWDFKELQQTLTCVVCQGTEKYCMDGIPLIEFFPYVPEDFNYTNSWNTFEQVVEYKINYRRFR